MCTQTVLLKKLFHSQEQQHEELEHLSFQAWYNRSPAGCCHARFWERCSKVENRRSGRRTWPSMVVICLFIGRPFKAICFSAAPDDVRWGFLIAFDTNAWFSPLFASHSIHPINSHVGFARNLNDTFLLTCDLRGYCTTSLAAFKHFAGALQADTDDGGCFDPCVKTNHFLLRWSRKCDDWRQLKSLCFCQHY